MTIYQNHSSGRSIGWSQWHLQWCTKYRYRIFTLVKYKNLCKILIQECCKRHNLTYIDSEVDVDHVHILVAIPLTQDPIGVIHLLKGYTSRCLFILMPQLVKTYRGKNNLWSSGKFIGSVGHISLDFAKLYVQSHKSK